MSSAGLYVHVPFCQSRCLYCDFYSTTMGQAYRHAYVHALCHEMHCRADENEGRQISTVYLGGGTPSLLSADELALIFQTIRQTFSISASAEITIEVNPDDVSPSFCALIEELGVNRVSLGVQTFSDKQLRSLRRRHSSEQAKFAIGLLADRGMKNLSIDLIFGLPQQTLADWQRDLAEAFLLPVTHLSCYSLMYEHGTPLTRLRDRGEIVEIDEETSLGMYQTLIDSTAAAGFKHYEISNFARQGYRSQHNSAYWSGVPYLGFGPGAHSYDGQALRRANRPDVETYIAAANQGLDAPHDAETLTEGQRCDEQIFTALRTADGLALADFEKAFGKYRRQQLETAARSYIARHLLQLTEDEHLRLTRQGLYISDSIMTDLMIGEDLP